MKEQQTERLHVGWGTAGDRLAAAAGVHPAALLDLLWQAGGDADRQ
jgi:hypothetical protein